MRPELLPVVGDDPSAVGVRVLLAVADRVRGGYGLTAGRLRRRGGVVSNPGVELGGREMDAITRDLFLIGPLPLLGSRLLVGSLKALAGGGLYLAPDDRVDGGLRRHWRSRGGDNGPGKPSL